ncbi:hypothetical protein BGZ58_009451 [Dissophora ornata]|nr:hypothetical protein BGZ58_009451 [Dissophora ornata]
MIRALRSKIGHAFGTLKERWGSLPNLHININSEEIIEESGLHIAACVVLYDILTRLEILDDDEMCMYLPPEDDNGEVDAGGGRDGQGKSTRTISVTRTTRTTGTMMTMRTMRN